MYYTDDEVAGLSFDDKSNWLKHNPVTVARHFQYRLYASFQDFLKSTVKPLGEIVNHAIRMSFRPGFTTCPLYYMGKRCSKASADSQICVFIDKYISCELPAEDGKLRELVLLLQKHKHSSYCKRNKTCHFNFPEPPSPKTLITKFDPENTDVDHYLTVLKNVQKLIAENGTDFSLSDLIDRADLTESEYVEALETSLLLCSSVNLMNVAIILQ